MRHSSGLASSFRKVITKSQVCNCSCTLYAQDLFVMECMCFLTLLLASHFSDNFEMLDKNDPGLFRLPRDLRSASPFPWLLVINGLVHR